MKTKSAIFSLIAIAVAILSRPVGAQTVTFTSANGELSGLASATPGSGASATYVSGSPGYWQISSPDNVTGGGLGTFNDTASILVKNGYDGATLGTLNWLLGQGAAGNVSFNLLSMTPGSPNHFAYWDVLLTDPNNPLNTMLIVNAYGDNQLNANPFNQGSSVNASVEVLDGTAYSTLWLPWSTVASQTPIAGDGLLGTWNVSELGISVGGWQTGTPQTADISSVTVPGDSRVSDMASTLPLLGVCLGGLAVLRRGWRRS